jgi:phosphatidylinositol glycan class B
MLILLARGQDLTTYEDQTTQFYRDPAAYLFQYFPERVSPSFPPSPYPSTLPGEKDEFTKRKRWQHEWPSHLVMFDDLLSMRMSSADVKHSRSRNVTSFRDIVLQLGYSEVWNSGWNGWEGDEHRRGEVRLWQFSPEGSS